MSLALCLFDHLCQVGNALAVLRDREEPGCDQWTALTCVLLLLDTAVDTLVQSQGLEQDNEGAEEP